MEASMIQTPEQKMAPISDYAILIKKMRLLRRLTRQQAEHFFDFSFKNIEKLENGRGEISLEQFKMFQAKYGFSDTEVEALRSGRIKATDDAHSIRKKITTDKRENRRFCHRRIGRECKVLKELRLQKDLDQYSASKNCQYGEKVIGFIENGRIALTEKKIRHIVETYGFTMENYHQLLRQPLLRHEMIEQCRSIIGQMDENKLRIIMPMLQSMSHS